MSVQSLFPGAAEQHRSLQEERRRRRFVGNQRRRWAGKQKRAREALFKWMSQALPRPGSRTRHWVSTSPNGVAPRDGAALTRHDARYLSFSVRDRGMVFFMAFLVLTTIFLPMITLSRLGRLRCGAGFSPHDHSWRLRDHPAPNFHLSVAALTVGTFAMDLMVESDPSQVGPAVDTTMKVACLAVLVFMTLNRTLRPGRVTRYRVVRRNRGVFADRLHVGIWVSTPRANSAGRDSFRKRRGEHFLPAAERADLL